jgi:hypothetical protein
MKCLEQKKGCRWRTAKLEPEDEVEIIDAEPSTPIRVYKRPKMGPPVTSSSLTSGTKRKRPEGTSLTSHSLPTTTSFPPNRAKVVLYKAPPSRPTSLEVPIAIDSRPPSPNFSLVGIVSQPSVVASSSGPAPSIVPSSPSAGSYTSSSLSLRLALTQSKLDAANDALNRERAARNRERDTHPQEVQSLHTELARERAAYKTYIEDLQMESE